MTRSRQDGAKLPVQQLAILAICRLAETTAMASLDPYVPEMIESFGIPTKEVAKWAGMAGACYSVTQCLTAVIWGRMSDRLGRKYLLIASLCCTMLSSLLLGSSKTLLAFILVRAFGGAGSGSASIVDTMVAEMVPQKSLKPTAFSVMPLVWIVGVTFGPLLGGFLVQPAKQYPATFEGGLFQKYPFLLPPLVVSIIFVAGLTVATLFLRETLESRKNRKDYGRQLGLKLICSGQPRNRNMLEAEDESEPFIFEEATTLDTVGSSGLRVHKTQLKNLLSQQSSLNLLVGALLFMHSQAYDQLLPILMHHPVQDTDSRARQLPLKFASGFGMTSNQIGLLYTLYGLSGIIVQIFAFPRIAKKYGVLNCMKTVVTLFALIYLVTPFTALVPTSYGKQAALFLAVFFYGSLCTFAFPCASIMLTGSASSSSVLGTLTGVSVGTSAIGGAIGSVIGGNVFTSGVARGYLLDPYFALAIISIVAAIPVFYLKEVEERDTKDTELDVLNNGTSDEEINDTLPTERERIKVL